eukprot:5379845-Prymnesium_polylepis.1
MLSRRERSGPRRLLRQHEESASLPMASRMKSNGPVLTMLIGDDLRADGAACFPVSEMEGVDSLASRSASDPPARQRHGITMEFETSLTEQTRSSY